MDVCAVEALVPLSCGSFCNHQQGQIWCILSSQPYIDVNDLTQTRLTAAQDLLLPSPTSSATQTHGLLREITFYTRSRPVQAAATAIEPGHRAKTMCIIRDPFSRSTQL